MNLAISPALEYSVGWELNYECDCLMEPYTLNKLLIMRSPLFHPQLMTCDRHPGIVVTFSVSLLSSRSPTLLKL